MLFHTVPHCSGTGQVFQVFHSVPPLWSTVEHLPLLQMFLIICFYCASFFILVSLSKCLCLLSVCICNPKPLSGCPCAHARTSALIALLSPPGTLSSPHYGPHLHTSSSAEPFRAFQAILNASERHLTALTPLGL